MRTRSWRRRWSRCGRWSWRRSWRRRWRWDAVVEGLKESQPSRLTRDRRFLCVVVRAALNTRLGDTAIRISNQQTALMIDSRVDEVEQVAIIRNAAADDRS